MHHVPGHCSAFCCGSGYTAGWPLSLMCHCCTGTEICLQMPSKERHGQRHSVPSELHRVPSHLWHICLWRCVTVMSYVKVDGLIQHFSWLDVHSKQEDIAASAPWHVLKCQPWVVCRWRWHCEYMGWAEQKALVPDTRVWNLHSSTGLLEGRPPHGSSSFLHMGVWGAGASC